MKKCFTASLSNLYDMLSFIKENAHTHSNIFHIELVCEEVLVNIITHGSTDKIHIEISDKLDLFEITFIDEGLPFDPRACTPSKGRGLALMQQLTSSLSYSRDKDQNILTLKFKVC